MSDFDKKIELRIKNLNKNLLNATKASALAAFRGAQNATPYRTGHAQSNWVASNGRADTRERFGMTPEAALAEAETVIGRHRGGKRGIFIQNNASYIRFLEHGSPTTSAGNMTIAGRLSAQAEFLSHKRMLDKKGV